MPRTEHLEGAFTEPTRTSPLSCLKLQCKFSPMAKNEVHIIPQADILCAVLIP